MSISERARQKEKRNALAQNNQNSPMGATIVNNLSNLNDQKNKNNR